MNTPVRVTREFLRTWPLPAPGEQKNDRGVVLVVGGSATTPGAVLLSAEAALRAGCGKVQVATASSVAAPLAVRLPEGLVLGLAETLSGDLASEQIDRVLELAADVDVVLLGPGMTDPGVAASWARGLGPRLGDRLVLDAFATSYLGRPPSRAAVATMNPDELRHATTDDETRPIEDRVAALARRAGSVVLLGGTTKVIGSPDRLFSVDAGGVGLATAGSGDVQAGLVAGLLSRGAPAEQAAVVGGWLHAAAGDRVAQKRGSLGFLARELADEVPRLLDELAG